MEVSDTVVAVFTEHYAAEAAVKQLSAEGFDIKNLSVVGKGYHIDEKVVGFYNTGERVKFWGKLGAIGAALYSIGIPKDSVIQYETAVKADGFLVTARGTAAEMVRARAILGTLNPSRLDLHAGTKAIEPTAPLAHAAG